MADIPSQDARKIAAELAALRREVETLKKGNRHSQLGHSSINSGSLIAGNTDERHVRISKNGLVQRESTGEILTSFGAGSTQGNYLTITDPESGSSLASISANGTVSASGLDVSGDVVLNGENLTETLTGAAGGIQVLGSLNANTASSISEKGVFEIAHTLRAGRLYKVCSSSILARDGQAGIRIRYTDDGTAPTPSSTLMTTTSVPPDVSGTLSAIYGMNRTEDAEIRLLVTQVSFDGGTIYLAPPAGGFGMQVWVEDIGPAPMGETGSLPGGSEPPIRQYTTTWNSTWSRSFDKTGIRTSNNTMYQGYAEESNSDLTSMVGFDDDDIATALAGATIDKVEVYVYATHWYYNAGGWVCLGTHSEATPPEAYPGVRRHVSHFSLPKPGGNWVDITNTPIGEYLQDGTAKGIVLDAVIHGNDLNYYGRFDGHGQTRPPAIRITYTK